jgi:gliding motility-associated-like protein
MLSAFLFLCNQYPYFSVCLKVKSLPKNPTYFLLLLLTFISFLGHATHYRAGEITYKQISPRTYEITVITYTDPTNSAADRSAIDVFWGDGKSDIVPRVNGNGEIINNDLTNRVKKNIYTYTHTYPGAASYIISIADPNRVDGIRNINNGTSVDIQFYVESMLTINDALGNNQSPVLLLPPIDEGCIGRTYTHNPAAYDPDGDSLAYTIVPSKMDRGIQVPNFTIPAHSDSFGISINDGQLTWERPVNFGHYNWVIRISEYRRGILVGYVERDMQVYINTNCDNQPPLIANQDYTCIEALSTLQKNITATDPNSTQTITLTAYGGPFAQINSPAKISPNPVVGPATGISGLFSWTPSCNAIRYEEFAAVFRAVDNGAVKKLTHINYWPIKVIGPAPKNVRIVKKDNGFLISWDRDTCQLAFGYRIYRRIDSSYYKPKSCETGVPAYTGYTLLDTTQGPNNASYFDDNFGKGISPLIRYCYIITAFYPPRNEQGTIVFGIPVEGYASEEVCDMYLRTKPIITKASVIATDKTIGKNQIEWIEPNILDTIEYPAPYVMQLQRRAKSSDAFQVIRSINYSSFAQLKPETVIDSLLNTTDSVYSYQVVFKELNTNRKIEESVAASTPRLNATNTNRTVVLNWIADVPWNNKQAIVYRKNNLNVFDSIGISNSNQYNDTGLVNGTTYCYRIETIGNYNPLEYPNTLLNYSQEICGLPVDTIRPCAPILSIDTPCNQFSTFKVGLNWTYPATCDQDLESFKVYWKKNKNEKWTLLATLPKTTTSYADEREKLKFTIAGCYAVSAVDTFGNESFLTNERCIDNCPYYVIPNVFTPNNDGTNDQLQPFPYRFIDRVDVKILNRWGQEVFHTDNINIAWNGKVQNTGAECPEGVYFYIVEVFESYLEGTKSRVLKGTVTIIR